MSAAAKPLGVALVQRERDLDQLFASGYVTAEAIVRATPGIAELQGQPRSIHLPAHVRTHALVDEERTAH